MSLPVRFLVDEDFDNDIVRGILRRNAGVDLLRVQDAGLSGKHDADVLEFAANTGRIVLTHDVSTMKKYAYARLEAGLAMPGVFAVSQLAPVGQVIESILIVAECSFGDEWNGQVRHLPL